MLDPDIVLGLLFLISTWVLQNEVDDAYRNPVLRGPKDDPRSCDSFTFSSLKVSLYGTIPRQVLEQRSLCLPVKVVAKLLLTNTQLNCTESKIGVIILPSENESERRIKGQMIVS